MREVYLVPCGAWEPADYSLLFVGPVSGSDNCFSQVLDWVMHHLDEPQSVDSLAARGRTAAILRGTFASLPVCRSSMGYEPASVLCQLMLEVRDASIESIAQAPIWRSTFTAPKFYKHSPILVV